MRKPDETFYLKWNNFQPNLAAGFQDLLQEETMVDVTLAVEGKYLQAHKIVLSISSAYFKDLFKINPCRHPIVIFKDIGYQEMEAILHFMYNGEAAVSEKDLGAFLRLAETLKVRGLADIEENVDESECAKVDGKDKGNDDSETETENENENNDGNSEEEKTEEYESPSSPDSIKRLKDSLKSKASENSETTFFESNVHVTKDSNSNIFIEEPRRKKRKLSSAKNSEVMEGPSCSQTYVINYPLKQEVPETDSLRLTNNNNDEVDASLEPSQPISNQEFESKDIKFDDMNEFGASQQIPDFDGTDAILDSWFSETDLRGKVVCHEGYKYKFCMLLEDGSKFWRCTSRYKKCEAELEVHPVIGPYVRNQHNHPQPKR